MRRGAAHNSYGMDMDRGLNSHNGTARGHARLGGPCAVSPTASPALHKAAAGLVRDCSSARRITVPTHGGSALATVTACSAVGLAGELRTRCLP